MAEMQLGPHRDWKGMAIGIGVTVLTAMILAFGTFMLFGFEKYVEGIATRTYANDGVPQAKITDLETRLTGIESALETQSTADQEFREQQAADMRNLVNIISRRGSDD